MMQETPEQQQQPLLLTPQAVAAVLSCSRTTVYELLGAGELRSVKIGRSRRIPRTSVELYVERLSGPQAGA